MAQFFDISGASLAIGRQIGNGGEGAVFELPNRPDQVAKLYHGKVPNTKCQKLTAMVQCASKDILSFAAWPLTTLHRTRGGEVCGIVMPKIQRAKDIHHLYSPAQRKSLYPDANWLFLLLAAQNCAIAFDTLHRRGIVIGDVNQGNVLVSDRALVSLIDCDSFQFNKNGQLFRCEVGVPHFTPPELQSAKFEQVTRTPNHDCFGLALLIFHLLFVGRHPFAGRFSGAGDMPIERAIREYRFAYSRNGAGSQMSPPPFSLPLTGIPSQLGDYFEAAFRRGSEKDGARPTAASWVQLLDGMRKAVRTCADDPGHVYSAVVAKCPWCEIVRSGGPNFFISATIRAYAGNVPQIDVASIWTQICSIQIPHNLYAPAPRLDAGKIVPQQIPGNLTDNQAFRSKLGWASASGAFLSVFGVILPVFAVVGIPIAIVFAVWWFVLYFNSPERVVRRERNHKLKKAQGDVTSAQHQLQNASSQFVQQYKSEQNELARIKNELQAVEVQRLAAQQKLQASARERQLAAYLDGFYIDNATIRGIGRGRVSVLESNGIETAADVNEKAVMSIPGFGPALTSELLGWRRSIESRFRFDPSKGVPQSEIQAIEIQFMQKRHTLERQLQAGPQRLKSIFANAAVELNRLDRTIAHLEHNVDQAKADLLILNRKTKKTFRFLAWLLLVALTSTVLSVGIRASNRRHSNGHANNQRPASADVATSQNSKTELSLSVDDIRGRIAGSQEKATRFVEEARSRYSKKDFAGALESIASAESLNRHVPHLALLKASVYLARGETCYGHQEYRQAIIDFTHALDSDLAQLEKDGDIVAYKPIALRSYQKRSKAYQFARMPDKSIADWAKAQEINPRIGPRSAYP